MKEIRTILKKIRIRFILRDTLKNLILGSSVAFVIGIIMIITSKFIPIYNVYIDLIYIFSAAFIVALLVTIILKPSLKKIAKNVDEFGLHQRITTALELEKEESSYKELQLKDALDKLKNLNYKNYISFKLNKNILIIFLFSCIFYVHFFTTRSTEGSST